MLVLLLHPVLIALFLSSLGALELRREDLDVVLVENMRAIFKIFFSRIYL